MASDNGKIPVSSKSQSKINLEKIKTEYTDALEQMCLSQSYDEYPYLISMVNKQNLIKKIWQEEIKSKNDKNYKSVCLGYFEVVTVGGSFNIKVKQGKESKLMLPYEGIFDILWPLHLKNGHKIPDNVLEKIQKKYFIPGKAIDEISKHCHICKSVATEIVVQKPFYCCSLDLIKMDSHDHCFNTVMVCEDVYTGFIHLTPISFEKQDSQICLELFKIFMDFGPPKQLNISNPIFEIAIDKFKELTASTPFDIKLIKKERREKKMLHLKALLKKWSVDSKSSNWAIGCYVLQRQLNSEIQGNRQTAPFESVFVYNKSPKNMVEISKTGSKSGQSNVELDTKLDAVVSKCDNSNKIPVTPLLNDSSQIGVTKEGPVTMMVDDSLQIRVSIKECDDSSKSDESSEEPVDTLEKGTIKEHIMIRDNSSIHVKGKEKPDAILVDDSSKCDGLTEEPDDILDSECKDQLIVILSDDDSKCVKFKEEQELMLEISSDSSNCGNLEDESDDITDSEYPKCIGIQIDDSDETLDDEDSKCVELLEPSTIFNDDSAKFCELNKESDVVFDDEIPNSARLKEISDDILDDYGPKFIEMQREPVPIMDSDILKSRELTKKYDAILNENDPKCVEIRTELVARLDGDILKSDKQTKEPASILDDDDSKCFKTDPVAIFPDVILKYDKVTKKPDAILNNDDPIYDEMEVEPEPTFDNKDPKYVEMQTESNYILDNNGKLREKLVILDDDDPKCNKMETEPELILTDSVQKVFEMQTNTTLNDNILKQAELTEESDVILNNDDPECDKIEIAQRAILSDKDPKCIKMQTESNATLDASKHGKLTHELNTSMILGNDQADRGVTDTDDSESDEPIEEVYYDPLKVDSKPTESKEPDTGPSLITNKPVSPKPSTSGLTGNGDYDSDDSDILIISQDPLA